MALDLSAASLVRGGGATLLVAAGLFVWLAGRGRWGNRAFGAYLATFGVAHVLFNLAARDPVLSPRVMVAESVLYAFSLAGLVVAAFAFLRPAEETRVPRAAVWSFLALAALYAAALFATAPGERAFIGAGNGVPPAGQAMFFYVALLALLRDAAAASLSVALAVRASRALDPRARAACAAVGAAVALQPAILSSARFAAPIPFEEAWASIAFGAADAGVILLAPLAWLHASWRGAPRAHLVALGILATASIPALVAATTPPVDPSPAVLGLVRTTAAALVTVAVLRHGALGFDLALPTARRGTIVAVGLVGFFVVAQIASEFLSATLGVVVGGMAAGALLFAAVPLQRAAEGLVAKPAAPVEPGRRAGAQAEEAYRDALRLALHDGAMTPAEERHLANLADRLGVTYAQALRLRAEVDDELKGAR